MLELLALTDGVGYLTDELLTEAMAEERDRLTKVVRVRRPHENVEMVMERVRTECLRSVREGQRVSRERLYSYI